MSVIVGSSRAGLEIPAGLLELAKGLSEDSAVRLLTEYFAACVAVASTVGSEQGVESDSGGVGGTFSVGSVSASSSASGKRALKRGRWRRRRAEARARESSSDVLCGDLPPVSGVVPSSSSSDKEGAVTAWGDGYCYLRAVTSQSLHSVAESVGPSPPFLRLAGMSSELFEPGEVLTSMQVSLDGLMSGHVSPLGCAVGETRMATLFRSVRDPVPGSVADVLRSRYGPANAGFVNESFVLGLDRPRVWESFAQSPLRAVLARLTLQPSTSLPGSVDNFVAVGGPSDGGTSQVVQCSGAGTVQGLKVYEGSCPLEVGAGSSGVELIIQSPVDRGPWLLIAKFPGRVGFSDGTVCFGSSLAALVQCGSLRLSVQSSEAAKFDFVSVPLLGADWHEAASGFLAGGFVMTVVRAGSSGVPWRSAGPQFSALTGIFACRLDPVIGQLGVAFGGGRSHYLEFKSGVLVSCYVVDTWQCKCVCGMYRGLELSERVRGMLGRCSFALSCVGGVGVELDVCTLAYDPAHRSAHNSPVPVCAGVVRLVASGLLGADPG